MCDTPRPDADDTLSHCLFQLVSDQGQLSWDKPYHGVDSESEIHQPRLWHGDEAPDRHSVLQGGLRQIAHSGVVEQGRRGDCSGGWRERFGRGCRCRCGQDAGRISGAYQQCDRTDQGNDGGDGHSSWQCGLQQHRCHCGAAGCGKDSAGTASLRILPVHGGSCQHLGGHDVCLLPCRAAFAL